MKLFKKFMCWLYEHDPKLIFSVKVGEQYITTYDCDCGKRVKFEGAVTKIPYIIIRKKFDEA